MTAALQPLDANEAIVVWLLPTEPDRQQLAADIQALAAEHGQHPFTPHVTLGQLTAPTPELLARVRAAAPANRRFTLDVLRLQRYPETRRSLVLDLGDAPGLTALRQALEQVGGFEPDPLPPHLSLLYRPLDDAAFARARRKPSPQRISFGEILAMRVRASNDAIETEHWRPA